MWSRRPGWALRLIFLLGAAGGPVAQGMGIGVADAREGAAEQKQEKKEETKKEEAPEDHNVTLDEDHGVESWIKRAHQATAASDWDRVIDCYIQVLKRFPEKVYRSERGGKAGLGIYVPVRDYVSRLIVQLPERELWKYRMKVGPAARQTFAAGLSVFDRKALAEAATTYFASDVGDNALYVLGQLAYDEGRLHEAAALWHKLLQEYKGSELRPETLLAKCVLAYVELGKKEAANELLQQYLKTHGDGAISVGHRQLKLSEYCRQLLRKAQADLMPQDDDLEGVRWETFMGNARHSKVMPQTGNLGVAMWCCEIWKLLGLKSPNEGKDPGVTEVSFVGRPHRFSQPRIADYHLVAEGDRFWLAARDRVACHAAQNPDPQSPYWRSHSYDGSSLPPRPQQDAGYQIWQERPMFATLHGEYLYVCLGPEFVSAMPFRGGRNNQASQPSNKLLCFKKNGGSLKWELSGQSVGNVTPEDRQWLENAYFVTSPTYHDGMLFVGGLQGGENSYRAFVCGLEAASGRPLWKTMICEAQPSVGHGYYYGALQDIGTAVTVGGGLVYYLTNYGAVGAVEPATGSIRWIRVYRQEEHLANHLREQPQGKLYLSYPVAPIYHQGLLLFMPQDSGELYAVEAHTGRTRWIAAKNGDGERLRYLLGVAAVKARVPARDPQTGRRLRHPDGTYRGWEQVSREVLVAAGEDIVAFEAQSGKLRWKKSRQELAPYGGLAGMGVLTQGETPPTTPAAGQVEREKEDEELTESSAYALVPTKKALLKIDVRTGKLTRAFDWDRLADPRDPSKTFNGAGNVTIAGDVLYAVGEKYVVGFFIAEELERKMQRRLQANPGDYEAKTTLGDVYHRLGRYREAVGHYQGALAILGEASSGAPAATVRKNIPNKLFESYYCLGRESREAREALDCFTAALGVATNDRNSVRALLRLGALHERASQWEKAIANYQRMLERHGDYAHKFEEGDGSVKRVSILAEAKIAELIQAHGRAGYLAFDQQARTRYGEALAGKDVAALEALLSRYPNCEAHSDVLVALGELWGEKGEPAKGTRYLRRHLRRFGDSPRTPEVYVKLVTLLREAGMTAAATATLRRLERRFPSATVIYQNQSITAAQFAELMRQTPHLSGAKPGGGRTIKGVPQKKWQDVSSGVAYPLSTTGTPPAGAEKYAYVVLNSRELRVYEGSSGKRKWTAHLRHDVHPVHHNAAWCKQTLVLFGPSGCEAYDAISGKFLWRYDKANVANVSLPHSPRIMANGDLVAIADADGSITVLDGASGQEKWKTKLDGHFFGQELTEDTLVVATNNKNRVHVYDVEAGSERFELTTTAALASPPLLGDEKIYLATSDHKLSCHDAMNGKLLWKADLGRQTPLRDFLPHLDGNEDLVIASLPNGLLQALDATNGKVLWSKTVGGYRVSCSHLGEEELYLAVQGGGGNKKDRVECRRLEDGELRWVVDNICPANPFHPAQFGETHILIVWCSLPGGRGGRLGYHATLVDRRTGKRVWSESVDSRHVEGEGAGFTMIDGGVVMVAGNEIRGYIADGQETGNALEKLPESR